MQPVAACSAQAVQQQLRCLSRELRDLDIGQVPVIEAPITPLQFYRDFVAANKPCLIKGAIDHWRALHCWRPEYFDQKWGSKVVTVDVTPNGRGDAVTQRVLPDASSEECFATPEERSMTVSKFLQLLHDSRASGVKEIPYVQHQNNNLLEEWEEVLEDVEAHLPWATEAFGCLPEAVNLWIGDDRSTTSFHKDHYENMYAVVSGCKIFTLLPPCEVYRMHLRRYPAARFAQNDGGELVPVLNEPRQHVMWSPIDPYPSESERVAAVDAWPFFFDPDLPPPLRVEVLPGDVLYLPSIWYHYVQQSVGQHEAVIAVNYWYDMKFDVKYAYFKLVEGLASEIDLVPKQEEEDLDAEVE